MLSALYCKRSKVRECSSTEACSHRYLSTPEKKTRLYHKHRGDGSAPRSGLSLLHKLKLKHIQLNSFSKMKVRLAAQAHVNS